MRFKEKEQEIIKLILINYSNSKFGEVHELLNGSVKGKNILAEFKKYEDRLNYYLSITSIYHTILNISSVYVSLSIMGNDKKIISFSADPKGVTRMRLEPFIGLLIIQFQKLSETHQRFTGAVKDEKIRISREESELKIFQYIKKIKNIKEFKNLRDGSFAHPFEGERSVKVYRNQVVADELSYALKRFCESDFEEIKSKLFKLVNEEVTTGNTRLNAMKLSLPKGDIAGRKKYKELEDERKNIFNEFKFLLNEQNWYENFNLLFHGFVSYYLCSARLVIENDELKYITEMNDCVLVKSLYDYSDYVKKNYLKNQEILLINDDESFNTLKEKIQSIVI
ncbi:hypothetical protein C4Y57_029690 [Klebsiella variicola]|nr:MULTISPECIES: hypothetical protein [Klebsiella]HCB0898671.1 hypothetical protein [Klebsiella variicola subsp. variicola]HCM8116324.1 hypothetical protein [Klebsiella quasipneumoniae]HEN5148194.1 hypothetical protein [Klebsiella quasipneumoniae subsp. similipneumoniae]ROG31321.1 hypothetical protein C4Y57_029690 [Klebsiella variicola]SWL28798.1 Uncharacterised protein [Klebsiella pneumoniae]